MRHGARASTQSFSKIQLRTKSVQCLILVGQISLIYYELVYICSHEFSCPLVDSGNAIHQLSKKYDTALLLYNGVFTILYEPGQKIL